MKTHFFQRAVLVPVFCLIGLAILSQASAANRESDALYNSLFPYYVKACSVTQIKEVLHKAGGVPGHAVMYMHGMCRVSDSPYPKIRLCQPGEASNGVLISVDKVFKNVNWVAIDGMDMAFYGEQPSGARINIQTVEETVNKAVASGAFRGIEMRDRWAKQVPNGMTHEQYLAKIGVGTDYALNFARTSYCDSIPVTQLQMTDMANYLNGLNSRYFSGERDYDWNGITNNCAHVVENALAVAGIGKFKETERKYFKKIREMVIPGNMVLRTAEKVLLKDLPNVLDLYWDVEQREYFERYGRFPIPFGAVAETYEARHENNENYEPRRRMWMVDFPFLLPKRTKLNGIFSDPTLTEVRASLELSKTKYAKAIQTLKTLPQLIEERPRLDSGIFKDFYTMYSNWLQQGSAEIDALIGRIDGTGPLQSQNIDPVAVY